MSSNRADIIHSEFVVLYLKGKVDILWNSRKLLSAFYEQHDDVKTLKYKILKSKGVKLLTERYERYKIYFWIINILLLVTPLRLVIFISVIFSSFMYGLTKLCERSLISSMLVDEDLFYRLQDDSVCSLRLRS